jgi:hypothetical protein
MKKINLILVIVFILLISCSKKDDPIKPNNKEGNGTSILYGTVTPWGLINRFSNSVWDSKQAGIKVEVVGTTISSMTDGYGEFILRGLDSGVYSIRFSKKNYETLQIDSIYSNGIDSTKIKYILKDSLGNTRIYDEISLLENTPIIEIINAIANAKEEIWVDTLAGHGVKYDTTYSFQASFSINLQSNIKETQDSLPVGCLIRITNKSTVESTEKSSAFYGGNIPLNNGWLGYYGHTYLTKPVYTGTRDFTLARSEGKGFYADLPITLESFSKIGNYQIKKTEQLYLHIIPIVNELKRVQHSNRFSTWFTFEVQYKFGELKTIPIVWK